MNSFQSSQPKISFDFQNLFWEVALSYSSNSKQEKLCDGQNELAQCLQDIKRKHLCVSWSSIWLDLLFMTRLAWHEVANCASYPSASSPTLFALHSSLHPPEAHPVSPSCGISLPASPPLRFAPLSPNCQFMFRSIRTACSARRCAGGLRVAPAGPVPDQSLGNVVATSRLQ